MTPELSLAWENVVREGGVLYHHGYVAVTVEIVPPLGCVDESTPVNEVHLGQHFHVRTTSTGVRYLQRVDSHGGFCQ